MSDHNYLSENEEMYLVTIRKICEDCEGSIVPISKLAEALSILPVSVNQMVKKLKSAGMVAYKPYKGVELTTRGQDITTRILRRRRLWEVFLVKNLEMELEEADALACRLEHLTSELVDDRLSHFLDYPTVCLHGLPIYSSDHKAGDKIVLPLSDIKVGQNFRITRVEGDESSYAFLSDQGIYPGSKGRVLAVNDTGVTLMETDDGNRITLANILVEKIFVEG